MNALEVKNIYKSFPGVNALSDVSFCIQPQTVHVLCGENGAGKSTIMKILDGVHQPDSGEIFINGKKIIINSPIDAKKHGIAMIFQELNYIPEMSIAEFMILGEWTKTKLRFIDWKNIYKQTEDVLAKENLFYNPQTKLKDLSISDIQMLEITKAVNSQASIIIMDEPTSAITQQAVDNLLHKIYLLKKSGKSIVYVSHKMDEIFKIADYITVLRDGCVIESAEVSRFDIKRVISLMVGRELAGDYPKEKTQIGKTLLQVKELGSDGVFEDVNFYIRSGEIIGFAGLMGAGRTEIVRAVSGLDIFNSGEIIINSESIKIKNVRDAIKAGVIMVSEDRRRYGLIPISSIKENVTLSQLKKYIYHGYTHHQIEKRDTKRICDFMKVKMASIQTSVDSLSGGNQQKVVLAKWTLNNPRVFLLDEPTRGIDVGAKYEIYKLMQSFVNDGKAILMVSSELPELLGMCDRIYVVCEGKIAGEVLRKDFSSEYIMSLATGTQDKL